MFGSRVTCIHIVLMRTIALHVLHPFALVYAAALPVLLSFVLTCSGSAAVLHPFVLMSCMHYLSNPLLPVS
jgi:hypothetical protein